MVISMVKSIPNFGPYVGAVQGLYPEGKSPQKDIRIIIKKCTAKWHASTHSKMCKREWLTPAISNSQSSQPSKGFTKLSEVPILQPGSLEAYQTSVTVISLQFWFWTWVAISHWQLQHNNTHENPLNFTAWFFGSIPSLWHRLLKQHPSGFRV